MKARTVAHPEDRPVLKIALLAASLTTVYSVATAHPGAPAAVESAASPNFTWSGTIPSGGWLRIRNLAGTVEVRRASGTTAEVTATEEPQSNRWWNSTPIQPVKFVTQRQGSDVVVCAVSDDMPRCDANDLSHDSGWNDDWHPQPMHVIVQLPAGVSLQTGTMHGDLSVRDASGEVIARTGHGNVELDHVSGIVTANSGHGNVTVLDAMSRVSANTGHGDIHVRANGAVTATTGHGDIVAELASSAATGNNDMTFDTGHGNVRVIAPASLAARVDMHTGHGRVSTSFPLTMDDGNRHGRNESASGTLGGGSRALHISTGHGDASLTSAR